MKYYVSYFIVSKDEKIGFGSTIVSADKMTAEMVESITDHLEKKSGQSVSILTWIKLDEEEE